MFVKIVIRFGRAKKWAVLGMKKIVRTGRHVGYKIYFSFMLHVSVSYVGEGIVKWDKYIYIMLGQVRLISCEKHTARGFRRVMWRVRIRFLDYRFI